jgi:hypothetical protein
MSALTKDLEGAGASDTYWTVLTMAPDGFIGRSRGKQSKPGVYRIPKKKTRYRKWQAEIFRERDAGSSTYLELARRQQSNLLVIAASPAN